MLRRSFVLPALLLGLVVYALAQQNIFTGEEPHPRRPPPISVLPYNVAFLGIVFIQGTVNGQPVSLLFDTDANGSLNSRWLQAAHMQPQSGYQASGAGPEMAAASVLPHSSWRIGSAEIETNAVVLDLTSLEPVFGRTIDGIVGTDFLRRYAVELDPTDRQFRVYEAGTFQPTAQAVSIPLELDDNEYGGIQGSLYFGDKLAKGTVHGRHRPQRGGRCLSPFCPAARTARTPRRNRLSTGIG